jgi:CSLREA domain-containing protein
MGIRGVHRGAADHLEGLSRAAAVVGFCLLAGIAGADVTVTTIDDVDADDASCSLREAIVAANTDADYHGCVRTSGTIESLRGELVCPDDAPQM